MGGFCCNLCRSTDAGTLFQFDGRSIVKCRSCGLVGTDPLPTGSELARVYESREYFDLEYFKVDDQALGTSHYRQYTRIASLAKRVCGTDGRLLEIGPGRGQFLELCAEKGIRAEGVEVSSLAAERLKVRLPFQIRTGDLERLKLPNETYRMVAAFDVLEHLPDPMSWLREIRRILVPGGVLALSTVNIENLLDGLGSALYRSGLPGMTRRLYPPYHLYYFTPRTLTAYINRAGLSGIEVTQENYDVRKASSSPAVRAALRSIYVWHSITGRKTNIYLTALREVDDNKG